MTTYFIPGLGADKRVFSKLKLPEQVDCVYLEWILNNPNETLQAYTQRIAERIDTTMPFQLVGLSFGGIVAIEIAKILKPKQVIIISSISTSDQLAWYFPMTVQMLLNPFAPKSLLKTPNAISHWLFGASNDETKEFFSKILADSNTEFLRWAIQIIANWQSQQKPINLYHIHGTADKIFPIVFSNPDYKVKGGEHLMILEQYEEISRVLTERLNLFAN